MHDLLQDAETPDHDGEADATADAVGWHALGVELSRRGEFAQAVEALGRAVALRPNVAAFHVNLAEAYRNLIESQPEVETVQDKNGVLIVKMNEGVIQYSFLASRLIAEGYELTLFKEDEINLETAFMHLTKGITS